MLNKTPAIPACAKRVSIVRSSDRRWKSVVPICSCHSSIGTWAAPVSVDELAADPLWAVPSQLVIFT